MRKSEKKKKKKQQQQQQQRHSNLKMLAQHGLLQW